MRKDNYGILMIRGLTASLAGLIFIAVGLSYSSAFSTAPASVLTTPAMFFLFIVGPSEEMIFRYLVPLIIMVIADTSYIVGGVIGGVLFGLAHYWAYGGSQLEMFIAIAAGIWQSVIVWKFSMVKNGKFTFMPGLLAAMLGHGLYDYLVTTAPLFLLDIGIICAVIFGATYLIHLEEPEE